MKNANLKVLLVSERPEIQNMLMEVVQSDPGAVTVGHAENAVKAIALANNLRPNVVVVDSQLPHVVGSDGVRLSRIGGLDTVMSISQQLPKAAVILLSGADVAVEKDQTTRRTYELLRYKEMTTGDTRVKLEDLVAETSQAGTLVFATLRAGEPSSTRLKIIEVSDKAMMYGGFVILGGFGLMLTFILAGAGVFLAMGGAGVFILSAAVRVAAGLWPRRSNRDSK